MSDILAHTGLLPSAYTDPAVLEQERTILFHNAWQWVGLVEELQKAGGIRTTIAGLPLSVEGEISTLHVSLDGGSRRRAMNDTVADICGKFVFVRLASEGPSLKDYLGAYADVLMHCSEQFSEVYDTVGYNWECNWKAGIESLLEGYHVPYVHAQTPYVEEEGVMQPVPAAPVSSKPKTTGSNLAASLPDGEPSTFEGPHSFQRGLLGETMRQEMDGIAKRLKLAPSQLYRNYDQFSIFPNMIIGIAGGCLCFMHIYDPVTPNLTHMRNVYMLAGLADSSQSPSPLIKAGLLAKWRSYNATVIGEDRLASERRQLGMVLSTKPGFVGHVAEERVVHFHKHWKAAMAAQKLSVAA